MSDNLSPQARVLDANKQIQRAFLLLKERRYAESASLFIQLIGDQNVRDKGVTAEAVYGLGLCLVACGRFDDAERLLRRALILDPANANAVFHLAHIAELRRETTLSFALYREALRISPGHKGAKENLSALENRPKPSSSPSMPETKSTRTHHTEVLHTAVPPSRTMALPPQWSGDEPVLRTMASPSISAKRNV